ncbi:hypothetical protein WKT02_12090 [Erysipelotrichaceae bacterium HCN-30851]
MKKIFIFCLLFFPFTTPIIANESSLQMINQQLILPKKDVLVWKVKTINGQLYKRLYNQTKGRWESDWIKI